MLGKKTVFLCVILIAFLAVAGVSAADSQIGENGTDDSLGLNPDDESDSLIDDGILSAGPKSFMDLNQTINGNGNSTICLDDDYAFDSAKDSSFKQGIVIGRAVTINGNGHTLDGNGQARIFNVRADNVILKDINFIKGNIAGNGGAVYWLGNNGTLSNSSFTSNAADSYGGAVYWLGSEGFISNCSFEKNAAKFGESEHKTYPATGGALAWMGDNGSVENSSFSDNYAESNGGAIYWKGKNGLVSLSTFTRDVSKYKRGGAIYWLGNSGTVSKSSFRDNSAEQTGGAICWMGDDGRVGDSSFSKNAAEYGYWYRDEGYCEGGAIAWAGSRGAITNSSFTGNTALPEDEYWGMGGAVHWSGDEGSISKCIFTANLAQDGGALYWTGKEGSVSDSTFAKNAVKDLDFDSKGEIYWTKPSLYNTGGAIYWKGNSGTLSNSSFAENSAGEGGALYWFAYNGSISGCGFEKNTAKYGGAITKYANTKAAGCTFKSNKASVSGNDVSIIRSQITASSLRTTYNANGYLEITLTKANSWIRISNAKVTVKIKATKTSKTDKNGQIRISTKGLAPKTYSVKITFSGNDYYGKSSKTVKLTVKKATPKLTAKSKTFKKSLKIKKYSIILRNNINKAMKNAKVYMTVNGKIYAAKTNSKGLATFKITHLKKAGAFKATVSYNGNACYNKVTRKVNIICR